MPTTEPIETWAFRIAFAWRGPVSALAELAEFGTLKPTGRHEYAYTVLLRAGRNFPGTVAERQGRAAWIATDMLHLLLSQAVTPREKALWLTQQEVRPVDPRRVAARHVTRRREREWARVRERGHWAAIRRRWPTRAQDMAAYRRRRQARGRRR